ncbi:unnamed protein product, partial [Scytosiphon promiscuus]
VSCATRSVTVEEGEGQLRSSRRPPEVTHSASAAGNCCFSDVSVDRTERSSILTICDVVCPNFQCLDEVVLAKVGRCNPVVSVFFQNALSARILTFGGQVVGRGDQDVDQRALLRALAASAVLDFGRIRHRDSLCVRDNHVRPFCALRVLSIRQRRALIDARPSSALSGRGSSFDPQKCSGH